MKPATSLIIAAGMTWGMLVVAGLARSRASTLAGMRSAFGNREALSEPSAFAGRADRAARNMLENLALFGALLLAASWSHVSDETLALPCAIFVGARLAYAPLYWAGVKYVRTLVWAVSVGALGMVLRHGLP